METMERMEQTARLDGAAGVTGASGAHEPCDAHELGARGEQAAALSLMRRGWEIVERNWRCEYGEVDIVARSPECDLVFVEVKTRRCPTSRDEVAPELAVGEDKQLRYARLAERYLAEHPGSGIVRFDVIAITDGGAGSAHLRQISNAFPGVGR